MSSQTVGQGHLSSSLVSISNMSTSPPSTLLLHSLPPFAPYCKPCMAVRLAALLRSMNFDAAVRAFTLALTLTLMATELTGSLHRWPTDFPLPSRIAPSRLRLCSSPNQFACAVCAGRVSFACSVSCRALRFIAAFAIPYLGRYSIVLHRHSSLVCMPFAALATLSPFQPSIPPHPHPRRTLYPSR